MLQVRVVVCFDHAATGYNHSKSLKKLELALAFLDFFACWLSCCSSLLRLRRLLDAFGSLSCSLLLLSSFKLDCSC